MGLGELRTRENPKAGEGKARQPEELRLCRHATSVTKPINLWLTGLSVSGRLNAIKKRLNCR